MFHRCTNNKPKKVRHSMTSPGSIITATLTALTVKQPRSQVVLNDLWKDQTIVLRMLRRFGCPLCRYESKIMSSYKPEFDRLGVKMVAVGFDEVGLEEWIQGKFWSGEQYMDPERKVYQHFGLERKGMLSGILSLFSPQMRDSIARAKLLKVGGNYTKGDGFVLGGTYVIDKTGKILYEFKQTGAADYPSMKAILSVVGGDPDIVRSKDEPYSPPGGGGSAGVNPKL